MVPKEPTGTLMSLSVERKKPLPQTEANTNRGELQKKKKTREEHTQQARSKKDLIVHKP
jgi:hypothetical protein